MISNFVCHHCKKRYKKNPRLKIVQRYCGSKECQQARKNSWERNKLKTNSDYKQKRKASKSNWYLKRPGYEYQKNYRLSHPSYVSDNRSKQQMRNSNRNQVVHELNIVKTDALIEQLTGIQPGMATSSNRSP